MRSTEVRATAQGRREAQHAVCSTCVRGFPWLHPPFGDWLPIPPRHPLWHTKDVGCRSNFDPSRPLYTQDTSFSVKSSLTAVCQGVQTLSTDMFACDRHTPKYLLGKNLLPEKYLGSKYLSRSRFLRNIPRVIFGREIFPENIPRKTLLAVPKNWKHA